MQIVYFVKGGESHGLILTPLFSIVVSKVIRSGKAVFCYYGAMNKYLVTGASRGIGLATAQTLLEKGHFVHGTYNTGQEAVAESLKKTSDNVE